MNGYKIYWHKQILSYKYCVIDVKPLKDVVAHWFTYSTSTHLSILFEQHII